MTLPARLADATQADIELLISTGAQEGQQQDFKRDFPTQWNDGAKARLLADVTSFANSAGGDIIYGLDEDAEAKASRVVPQVIADVDVQVRTLQQIALDQTEPRVPGIEVRAIPVTVDGVSGHVIVMRVPQSWAAPHRNRMNNHFHVREGVRNRPLDVPEVRAQFLRSESLGQKLRDFRSDRLAKIVTGQTPVKLGANPKLVVHAISSQAAQGQVYINPVPYTRGSSRLPVLGTVPVSPVSLNLDGAFGPITAAREVIGYAQQFRQGYFETVWELSVIEGVPKPALPGVWYEDLVNQFLGSVRGRLDENGVSWELVVFLSLVGADQALMVGDSDMGPGWGFAAKAFDRQDILLPEVVIPADVKPGRGMRPAYDLMFQAAGFVGSPNYGDDGEWKKRG
ncbi:MAG: hypothetical protein DI603_23095 [Roseateles depolymerans]|uniref:Schlafen AlbA-2 domain-containing protein n=1 Tax=Roseateles depolymerans TaxID=76731 RepID=A0A2W5DF04_9BURK|nr:MAG: hypothetical protein DI603_23095 [Roseateles depolymerans]